MNIFRLFQSKKFYENMLQNASNCTIKKKVSGKYAPELPPIKRLTTPRVASPPPPPKKKKSWPP